jgi:hypothetical protein
MFSFGYLIGCGTDGNQPPLRSRDSSSVANAQFVARSACGPHHPGRVNRVESPGNKTVNSLSLKDLKACPRLLSSTSCGSPQRHFNSK